MAKMMVRDAEGGPWREYRGELLEGGRVLPAGTAAAPAGLTFTVGVDLGQVADYSAFAVLESHRLNPGDPGEALYHHEVSHLERHRGELYPVMAARVAQLCAGLPAPPFLAIDETGCGRPVCDQLRLAAPRVGWFAPVTITSGQAAAAQPDGSWHVSKRLLVSATQVALQTGRLKVGKNLPLAQTLVREMLSFKARILPSGAVTYGTPDTGDWRSGPHDDLLLAVALGVWAAEHRPGGWAF